MPSGGRETGKETTGTRQANGQSTGKRLVGDRLAESLTPRTGDRFPLDELDPSGKIDSGSVLRMI